MENIIEMIWQSTGGLVAVVGFGVVLGVEKRFLIWAGLDGALGWFLYLIVDYFTESMLLATFFGAVLISIGAHVCARIFKTPVTMFLIPANMTLVPGAGMYRIVYYILKSEKEMSSYFFQQTLLAAGMIAIAIFVVNIVLNNFISGVKHAKKIKGR
ncbi:MAG: threonine/serine exporter [Clostridia bacterium]|nr:threonine/serine exporter [Clostridia bacterium]NCC43203.1 threonine/serine exporter [Clostridia bacterium]